MFAITESYRAGLLAPKYWLNNLVAGVIVGVVALPLAMAFAIASGVKPEQGIYTAIIAGIVVSLFGGSRVQIAGPTGAFIVILAGVVADYGVAGLQLATLMAGIMLLVFGLMRMGGVIRYIPLPVILGFTAGIGVIIWVGQWQAFFGLPEVQGRHFHEKLVFLLESLPQFDMVTTLIGIGSLILVLLPQRVDVLRKVPGPLLALIFATLLQALVQFPQVATIGNTFGELPRSLPMPALPDWSLGQLVSLVGPAFTIALLGAIESLLSAVVADNMAGTRHNSNAELIGQGAANIITPLFGGIAATGAIARTATNIRSGGNSPLAGIVHSLVLVLVLLLLAPLARNIPLATLAAILFVVAWNMSELKRVRQLISKAPRADVIILAITFLLTVFTDLVVAVNIGIVMSILQFLRRMAASVKVDILSVDTSTAVEHGAQLAPLKVVRIQGPLFFAAVDNLKDTLRKQRSKTLVLCLELVPFADATALQALDDIVANANHDGMRVLISGANARITTKLYRMGTVGRLHANDVQPDLASTFAHLGLPDYLIPA